ncbi:MAG: ATP-binding protein [Pseudomonadota bacterium]
MRYNQPSLFRRLMTGFAGVLLSVTFLALAYVVIEAKANQRWRTGIENTAHTRELLLHLAAFGDQPEKLQGAVLALETVRLEMFKHLGYGSRVRLRIWKDRALIYNSSPELPALLPAYGTPEAVQQNSWASWTESDAASGITVERSHEVDDEWMLSLSGINVLMSSTTFSLPLLLLPAWFIVGFGLRPLRSIAALIEQRDEFDLTALPESQYRELAPLVDAINRLLARLKQRIEREHEFITDAAHELKTPLAAIQINAHVILSRCDPAAKLRCAEAAEGLDAAIGRASHMVHQLLALERANTESNKDPLVPMELGGFIRDRMAALAPLAVARGIEIALEAEQVAIRPLHVESMAALFDNLLGNAIKYSPDDSCVTVRLDAAGGGQRLAISDEGPGINPKFRRKVFERFYRIPGQLESGSGLGLAIAESAAFRNNARISLCEGDAGKGLRVVVDFAAHE